jgi:2-dehydro-3-deoxyphosphogluconate aldolase/(4S)-4-hydroxy-2-oxoglutarate aldolase
MATLLKYKVINEILEVGLVPVFYNKDVKTAEKIIQACAEGGAKIIEFIHHSDLTYEVFSELIKWSKKDKPDIILGAGNIIDRSTADLFINCGANFITGTIFNPDVAKICNRRKIAYIPGCMTPSEISEAEETGVDIVKVFPGNIVGPEFIKTIMGSYPWFRLMPSGGIEVDRQNIFKWIKAGASALNIGRHLINKDLIKADDYNSIKELVSQCINWIKEARIEAATST